MNHFVISASVASFCSFLTAIAIWFQKPYKAVTRVFSVYWFSIAFWAFFVGTQFQMLPILSPFWWGWLLLFGCTFIPVLLFHATILLTRQATPMIRRVLVASYLITILFNLLNLLTPTFTRDPVYTDAYAYPKPDLFFPLYFLLFVVLVIWSTILALKHLVLLPQMQRRGLTLLLVTQTIAYLGGMDNFLIMFEIRLPVLYPCGLYAIPFYALAMSYAVFRCRLFGEETGTFVRKSIVETAC